MWGQVLGTIKHTLGNPGVNQECEELKILQNLVTKFMWIAMYHVHSSPKAFLAVGMIHCDQVTINEKQWLPFMKELLSDAVKNLTSMYKEDQDRAFEPVG